LKKQSTKKGPTEIFSRRLLSSRKSVRPDDVISAYKGVTLNLRLLQAAPGEGKSTILIEGDKKSLLFLADLLLSQAVDPLDCGIGISPTGPGSAHFDAKSEYGIYVHALQCLNEEAKVASPQM
jgi:hypothetical protein